MESVWVALIVSVIAPIIVGLITSWNNRVDKRAQWEREDAVAAKSIATTKVLLAANERVAVTTKDTNNKVDVIHSLVNSNMTATLQAEYESTKRELGLLLHVVELNKKLKHEPNKDIVIEIDRAKMRVAELYTILELRQITPKRIE